jgi:Ca2+-binding RTX toxin-like protein
MTRTRSLFLLLTAVLSGLGLTSAPASAGTYATCEFDVVTGIVTFTLHEGYINVRRSGDAIVWNNFDKPAYQPCGGATVTNTEKIVLNDKAGEFDRTFHVDQSKGRFEPGRTEEDSGVSEIEFEMNYDGSSYTALFRATGTVGPDKILVGDSGLLLNRDTDRDVTIDSVGFFNVNGGEGNDRISFLGGQGTGSAVGPTEFFDNTLVGGRGADKLIAGPGYNNLDGGRGDDRLKGGGGDDYMTGSEGDDHLDGEAGDDACKGGSGTNTVENCER